MKHVWCIHGLTTVVLCLTPHVAFGQQEGVEVRAARVCAGIGQGGGNFQGELNVGNLNIEGNANGTVTLKRDGVDLGKIEQGTYKDYTACLIEVIKLVGGERLSPASPTGPLRMLLETGRAQLTDLGKEAPGYGLYSYAILTSNSNRSATFLKEVFDLIPTVEDNGAEPSQINILYLPTKRNSLLDSESAKGQTPVELGRKFSSSLYDYRMARAVLNHICNPPASAVRRLCQEDLSRGPYLFTYSKPASVLVPIPPPFLFVDLSDVDPGAFGEYIAAFRAQVKREDISDGARINTFRLTLLNIALRARKLVTPIGKSIADIVYTANPENTRGKASGTQRQ
jgi:hypothetical protein